MPKDKTDNFLKAIKKYAKEQKTAMHGEVKQLKTERLKEAESFAEENAGAEIGEVLSYYREQFRVLRLREDLGDRTRPCRRSPGRHCRPESTGTDRSLPASCSRRSICSFRRRFSERDPSAS